MACAVIVGSGPAGISAALYLRRANVEVTVLSKGQSALEKADRVENYYGFAGPVSGRALLEAGAANARRLGCVLLEEEVTSLEWGEKLTLKTAAHAYEGDVVVLATGAVRSASRVLGLAGYEGRGVSWCAVCDGFFYRGKKVAVLGEGEYALHEAMELLPLAESVTLLTNGKAPAADFPPSVRIEQRKIARITGEQRVEGVLLEDGGLLETAGVFVAEGVASSGDLARKVGAQVEGNRIVVNERMETNIPGLYAAGDCTGGLLQIAKAVSDGAVAGTSAVKYLRQKG